MSSGTVLLEPGALSQLIVTPFGGGALDSAPITSTVATVLITRAAVAQPPDPAAGSADAPGRWQATAAGVLRVNSELRMTLAAIRRAGLTRDPDLPPPPRPVALDDRTLTEVTGACRRAYDCLATVHRLLASRRAALRAAHTGVAALAEVNPEADDAEVWLVVGVAARAAGTAGFWPALVGETVQQVNSAVERARRSGYEAAAYLEGIAAARYDSTDPVAGRVLSGLESVLHRRSDLVSSLREDARWLIAEGERAAARRYVTLELRRRLTADGYHVRAEFGAAPDAVDRLELSASGWPDQVAEVSVGHGRICHRAFARRPPHGWAGRRADTQWSDRVRHSMTHARRWLDEIGVGTRDAGSAGCGRCSE